jgi:hypothetical protein
MKPSSYLLVIIIIISLVFGGVALSYSNFNMKLLPTLVSGLIFILASWELSKEILAARQAPKVPIAATEPPTSESMNEQLGIESSDDLRGDLLGFSWLIGMIIATYLIGLLVAIPIFIILYLRTHQIGWLKSILLAALMEAFTYFIFVKGLQIELFPGIIADLFM